LERQAGGANPGSECILGEIEGAATALQPAAKGQVVGDQWHQGYNSMNENHRLRIDD
jgi:hypothetical protein